MSFADRSCLAGLPKQKSGAIRQLYSGFKDYIEVALKVVTATSAGRSGEIVLPRVGRADGGPTQNHGPPGRQRIGSRNGSEFSTRIGRTAGTARGGFFV